MSDTVYFLTIGLLLGTILLIFGMKYFSAFHQARSRTLDENAYRSLAEKAAAAQTETAVLLSSIRTELSQITTRLADVEKILKAVE